MKPDIYNAVDNLEAMLIAEKYNAFLCRQIRFNIGAAKKIVDFGAGIGTFAKKMKCLGYDVVCVEPDHNMANELREDGFEVVCNIGELGKNSLNAIYMLNVLEHIENDRDILRDLREALKIDGKIYIYVPAFNCLYSSMDKKVGHVRRYTIKELHKNLSDAGFFIEKINYVDFIGFFVSLVFKYFGDKSGGLSIKTVKIYDRFLFPISRGIDKVMGRICGKNLEAVARKVQ